MLVSNAVRDPEAAKRADFFRGLTIPDLPTRFDARVVKYLDFYRDDARGRSIARTWAKKCARLAPALKAMLARAGLPTDLVWLSLIESGHNPLIVSPAGAAGLWQFIPESARMYGLTVDRWVDERLDPERSTEAAVRYLSDLRARFGSWDLAMAAYNMGHGGLLRAVRKYNTNDYWTLSRYEAGLPWETSLYVPKILATAIVMDNKKSFGLDDVEPDAPLAYDTIFVGPNVELSEVARAAEASLEDIRALNAEYLALRTPPVASGQKGYRVRVPSGRGEAAEKKLAETRSRSAPKLDSYEVKFGDSLDAIAAETRTTVRELAQLNHVGADERLEAGTVLFVPTASAAAPESPATADEDVVVVPALRKSDPSRRRVYYRALSDDTIADVARAFDVSTGELGAWNSLDPTAHLQQGMTLQVFVKSEADLSRVRFLEEHEVRVLVAGTEEFFEYFEAQNGRKRLTVTVRKGDTLAVIAKRHGMTLAMMERINRIAADTVLHDGEHLVVYAKGEGSAEPPPSARGDLAQVTAPVPSVLPTIPPATAPGPNGSRAVGQ
jgi:membrane-bound lytic murein transglycosylase D